MTNITTTESTTELTNELYELKSTLHDVVSTLTFLQRFLESDYGMRFQFEAYRNSSSTNKKLSSIARGLETKNSIGYQQKQPTVTITIVNSSSSLAGGNPTNHLPEHNIDNSSGHHEVFTDKIEPSAEVVNADDSSNLDNDFFEPGHDPVSPNAAEAEASPSINTLRETEEYLCEKSGKTKIRKRRKGPDRSKWQRIMMQRARERGEAYMGTTAIERENGRKQNMNAKPRPPRKMGKPCQSPFCSKTVSRQCSRFTETDRKQIFNSFWKEKNWEEKKLFVSGLTERVFPKQPKMDLIGRRRGETINYYLPLGKLRLRVCRAMFISTVGIGISQLNDWVKRGAAAPDESKRPVFKMRKTYKKRDNNVEKEKLVRDGGFKCPYCLEIMGTRVEFTKHMANHMEQYNWNGGNDMENT